MKNVVKLGMTTKTKKVIGNLTQNFLSMEKALKMPNFGIFRTSLSWLHGTTTSGASPARCWT